MLPLTSPSVSDHLSFEQTLAKLRESASVDGIAEFGSRTTGQRNEASDFDLLLLVKNLPARVFQMITTIDERLADLVLVEVETADALLDAPTPPQARSFEALFAQKMKTARILYDASGRLSNIQQLVTSPTWTAHEPQPAPSDVYAAWFWQSFGLLQLERMAQSHTPIHQSAVAMMLTSMLPGTWRSYFELRGLPWEGEKAALRYWDQHDPAYLNAVRHCLEAQNWKEKLALYRELVNTTLGPVGKPFEKGETAIMLSRYHEADLKAVQAYWRTLLDKPSN